MIHPVSQHTGGEHGLVYETPFLMKGDRGFVYQYIRKKCSDWHIILTNGQEAN